jgi:hypothetical protein
MPVRIERTDPLNEHTAFAATCPWCHREVGIRNEDRVPEWMRNTTDTKWLFLCCECGKLSTNGWSRTPSLDELRAQDPDLWASLLKEQYAIRERLRIREEVSHV